MQPTNYMNFREFDLDLQDIYEYTTRVTLGIRSKNSSSGIQASMLKLTQRRMYFLTRWWHIIDVLLDAKQQQRVNEYALSQDDASLLKVLVSDWNERQIITPCILG